LFEWLKVCCVCVEAGEDEVIDEALEQDAIAAAAAWVADVQYRSVSIDDLGPEPEPDADAEPAPADDEEVCVHLSLSLVLMWVLLCRRPSRGTRRRAEHGPASCAL
jgi:hypothetical protein